MAGANSFLTRIYEADSGEKHFIRQREESAIFSIDGSPNTIPAGPPTSPFWAQTNRGSTEYGLRPRKLIFCFTPGQEPAGYKVGATYEIVIYSPAVYNAAVIGDPASYLGGSGRIQGRIGENIYPEV